MIKAATPHNESRRLNALRHLNILDTAAEERFDRVTRIAKELFQVPIVLISLIDENRQWFKSREGLITQQTSRDIAFCSHVILQDDMIIVEDATHDERFSDNPLVLGDPYIKFYLGCPLKVHNKYNVGAFCLIDKKPRSFTKEQQGIIRDLARIIETELESIHLTTTDELTNLTNRRGFLLIGEYLFNLCQRENRSLSLLFFDLDQFKMINDQFGHDEGDKVLKFFSEVLQKNFRKSDLIARLGGDEFCILCYGLKEADVGKLMQRLRPEVARFPSKQFQIHFSVGLIEYDEAKHPDFHSLLVAGDQKMYAHKKNKKNLPSTEM